MGAILLLSAALIGGVTVVGVLQSTERVGTSGIVTMPSPPSPPSPPPSPPPPEPTIAIDVYSDSGCTLVLTTIQWDSIEAGSSVDRTVYVKNSGDGDVTLSLITENWDPVEALDDMVLSWDYDLSPLAPGAVVELTLTLTVDSGISGISNFSFDIVIVGSAT